jgi:hypothetical protein
VRFLRAAATGFGRCSAHTTARQQPDFSYKSLPDA